MTKTQKYLRRSRFNASVAPVVLGLALISTPAFAQDEAAPQEAETAAEGEIIVTGSLITNPNLEQSSPVNVTTSDEMELQQSNVAEEILRELPGVVPSIGSAVNNGNGGASFVDLRGLGSNRNIVLLDGYRIAPSNFLGRVDLNNIPLALVERVDALTGAAVTTYGADAITGVVNFITKKDFAGVEVTASEQITEKGDGNIFRVDATIGANFDDGRGNAVFSVGYQEADPVYQGARAFSIEQVDSYTGGVGGSGTSVPSSFTGTRPIDPLTGLPSTNPAVANGGGRQIDPATGFARALYAPFNFNPYNIFQTPFQRFNLFGQARYEISDAVEVYTRGLFSKNNVNTIIAPSGSFGSSVTINLNNPFLPAGLRSQFCAFDTNTDPAIYTPRFSVAECNAAATAAPTMPNPNAGQPGQPATIPNPAYRTVTVNLSRRATEVGPRISDFQTTIFDYQAGLRGALTDSIDWNVAGSYGESENIQTLQGYVLTSRIRQALLTNDGVTCQVDTNGCVPANVFGADGSISPEAAAFLTADSTSTNRTSLAQVRGTISGDIGFSSPWAEEAIGFAVGGEYRKYTAQQSSDLLAQTPGELGGAGGAAPNIDGGYDVYEAFGEFIAPIVEDKPFFESLTLEAGIRYSRYKVDAPGTDSFDTWTWKAGGSWEPGAGFKIRGNFNRAVRAPNIGELFTPITTGLTNLALDPCAGTAPTTNANLRAVCLAQGAPVGTIGSITNPTAAQANLTFGGNLDLEPEKANTWTLGAVFQPDFLPGFSMSVDYYNIKITGAIGAPTPDDLISACFGNLSAASAADPNCTVIRRNPVTGGLDGDPATTPGLFGPLNNLGRLKTDGVDLTWNYQTDVGFGELAFSFVGNWTNSTKFKATPTGVDRECVGFYSVNCGPSAGLAGGGSIQPEFQFSQRTTLSIEDVDVSLLWRYLDSVQFEPAQLAADAAAADAANRDGAGVLLPVADQGCPDFNGADPGGCMVNPEFRKIPAEHYFDLSTRFGVSDNLTLTVTVQNLLNNKPKVVGNSIGSTTFNSGNIYPSTYDALGRRFAVSAKLKF